MKKSLNSKLQNDSMSSVRIFNILEVIARTSFSKTSKCPTLAFALFAAAIFARARASAFALSRS